MNRGHRRWHGRVWALLVPLLALLLALLLLSTGGDGSTPATEVELPAGLNNAPAEGR